MKKKCLKVLSLILVLSLLASIFALTACTDDDDEPRELDSVEKSIVGTWENSKYNTTIIFRSDGTCLSIESGTQIPSNARWRTFKHKGYGVDGELGHYEIIDYSLGEFALFDVYPNRLYSITSDGTVVKTDYDERQ